MLRRSHCRLFFPGMPGGAGGDVNQLQQMMQQQGAGGGCPGGSCGAPGAGGMNPQMMQQLAQRMQSPDMQGRMRDAMAKMGQIMPRAGGGGDGGGKVSMVMMGVGENERGKKVARAAKLDFDMATGKISKDFHEKQLDPDDLQLPKETVENYDTEDCIEVTLEDPVEKIESESGMKK